MTTSASGDLTVVVECMDSCAELRALLELLLEKWQHPLRTSEHALLDRLLYKNRSQHRHGLYFRRLEHVRRAYRTACSHRAWTSIDAILHRNYAEIRSTLGFSTVDLEEIERVHGFLAHFAAEIIPSAALSVINQLVLRRHFTNFSVTVVAVLARLFVIENNLSVQIAGVLSQMRLLLAVQDQAAHLVAAEDLGEHVQQELLFDGDEEEKACSPAKQAFCFAAAREPLVDPVAVFEPRAGACQSLYDIIAPDDPEAGEVLQALTAAVPFPSAYAAPSLPFGRPSALVSISNLVTDECSVAVKTCSTAPNMSTGSSLLACALSSQDCGNGGPGPPSEADNNAGDSAPLTDVLLRVEACALPVSALNPSDVDGEGQCPNYRRISDGKTGNEAEEDIDDIFSALDQ